MLFIMGIRYTYLIFQNNDNVVWFVYK